MTSVALHHQWSDGSVTSVEVEVDNDYPDALDQARVTAVKALADAVAAMMAEDE